MTTTDRTYKQLINVSRKRLSGAVKEYNKAKTEKDRLWKIILMYRHFAKTAAKLCMLHPDILDILKEKK